MAFVTFWLRGSYRAGAAHPPEHVHLGALVEARHDRDLEVEALRPRRALALRLLPRVSRALDVSEGRRQTRWYIALHQGQVAAHIHDIVHLLDQHRAFIDARIAGGA